MTRSREELIAQYDDIQEPGLKLSVMTTWKRKLLKAITRMTAARN